LPGVDDTVRNTCFRGHDEAWPSEGAVLDSRVRGNDTAIGGFRLALPALQCYWHITIPTFQMLV